MNYEFDLVRITKLLMDFYKVTNQRMGIFDADFKLLSVYPEKLSDYCALVRRQHEGVRRCVECDRSGMLEAKRTGQCVIYRCHAGMVEVCAPIIDDQETIGYLMFGQFIFKKNEVQQKQNALSLSRDILPDMVEGKKALDKVRVVSKEYIEAASNIMTACIGYIRYKQLISQQREGLFGQINTYIKSNVNKQIYLSEMAEKLSVCVATLCKTVKRHTGKTIGQLILNERINLAKDLLYSSDLLISEISERVGIQDYNYFTRLFKLKVGMTPRQYRKCGSEPKKGEIIFKNFN